MASLIFLLSYFSDSMSLAILIGTLVLLVILLVFVKSAADKPRTRSVALLSVLGTYIFFWAFLTSSIAICFSISDYYLKHPEYAIKSVLSSAFFIAILTAIPSSIVLKGLASRSLLKSIKDSSHADVMTESTLMALASTMKISSLELHQLSALPPISFAISGKRNAVVVSDGLKKLLEVDELETVLAHELSHIRHKDSTIKAITSLLRRAILFDPLLRLIDSALSREVEFRADEESALVTGKPRSLASALIKIHRNSSSYRPLPFVGLCLMGGERGLFSRHPVLSDRVERLLRLAQSFES